MCLALLDFLSASSKLAVITMCFHAQAHGRGRQCALILTLFCFAASIVPLQAQQQFRAAWADIFHVGMGSTSEVNSMVSSLVAGHYNAVIVQVVGYMDQPGGIGSHGAQYKSSILPWSSRVTASFDPLAYLCTQAHANGIEVHAWIGGSGGAMYRVSTAWPPVGNATLSAHPEWMMVPQANSEGGSVVAINGNYMLDMGGTDAQEYIVSIVRELVTNYPIDGINWDDEHDGTVYALGMAFPSTSTSTYTNSGLARYRRNTGFMGTPSATDSAYNDYRRRFKNELVARCQAEIQSIKGNPRQPLRHTSAVMAYGNPPSTCTFTTADAYTYYSDWATMLQNGWLDAAIPMAYKTVTNASVAPQLTNWCNRTFSCWRYSRHIYMGLGAYLNTRAGTVGQLQYAFYGQAGGTGLNGGVTYSYGVPYAPGYDSGDWWSYAAANIFTNVVSTPTMPWRVAATATNGLMWGRVQDYITGAYVDDATVTVTGGPTVKTDGNGYYVATLISATTNGTVHSTRASKTGMISQTNANATVLAGDVVRYDFMLNLSAPSINGQPQSLTVNQGSNATFTVTASGSAPLGYQWRFNSTNLTGATASSYTRNNAQPADAGPYSVVVSNAGASLTSSVATLTVNVPPGISSQPQNQTAIVGSNANFSVTATGTAPLSYQWLFNGSSISSATASNYTRTSAQTNDAGGYSVLVTNVAGAITSSVATLTVNVLPAISGQPQSQTVNVGSNATFTVLASGTLPLSYQWLFNGSIIPGATDSGYTRLNAQTNNAGGYSVLVTNVAGSATSDVAILTVTNPVPPPNITQQPASRAAVPGGSAQFDVSATGMNLAYQWQFNQSNISGATATSLINSNVSSADFGDYQAIVSNDGGSVTSSIAQLTLAVNPTLTASVSNSGDVNLTFNTETGPIYTVEYKGTLDDLSWIELCATNGTGAPQTVTDATATNAARIYRLHLR